MASFCPCGSARMFADCCAPFLEGKESPPTPEALMRSRYSAFCTGDITYLLATHKTAAPTALLTDQIRVTLATTRWLKLQVLHAAADGDNGQVEFVAFFREQAGDSITTKLGQLHELSRFRRDDGRWYYLDGDHLAPLKFARNDSCWCGSGKKLKKCCGT